MGSTSTVNPQLVEEIITTVLSNDEIEGAISSASVLYRKYLENKNIEPYLELEIKRWLAAHFVSLKDPSTRVDKEKIGDASVEYSKIGQDSSYIGLKSTRWGQQAIIFDPTGVLKNIDGIPPVWYAL